MYKFFLICSEFRYCFLNLQNECGVCGDNAKLAIKPNEPPLGKYATDVVVGRTYPEGAEIPVEIWFSANHKGWMEFRLCEHNDPKTTVTQTCLNEHLLTILNHGTRFKVSSEMESVFVNVKLPERVTCDYCVLQWYYRAGRFLSC